MNTAKQKRPNEQRFAITFPSVPVQTLRAAPKAYFAFRSLEYHFRQDYKSIFFWINEHVMGSRHRRQLTEVCRLLFRCVLRCAVLRRKLVDATVIVRAAVHSGAVEISESIDNHAVVGKATIRRAFERMNNTLSPLSAANRS